MADLVPEPVERGLRRELRVDRAAQAGFGYGAAVQFVVRSLTTSGISGTYGRTSRPARAGSRPSAAAAFGPPKLTRAACSPASQRIRSPIQGGTKSSVTRRRARAAHA